MAGGHSNNNQTESQNLFSTHRKAKNMKSITDISQGCAC